MQERLHLANIKKKVCDINVFAIFFVENYEYDCISKDILQVLGSPAILVFPLIVLKSPLQTISG